MRLGFAKIPKVGGTASPRCGLSAPVKGMLLERLSMGTAIPGAAMPTLARLKPAQAEGVGDLALENRPANLGVGGEDAPRDNNVGVDDDLDLQRG